LKQEIAKELEKTIQEKQIKLLELKDDFK